MLLTELWSDLNEANVIGTAVGRREIPEKYRKYPIIGQGSTSIVLEKDPNTVIMLTRDDFKVEWLTTNWGLGIGHVVETFTSNWNIHSKLHPIEIYVVEMPKLQPLDAAHKRSVKAIAKKFEEVWHQTQTTHRTWRDQAFQFAYHYFKEHYPDSPITEVLDWASNYDMKTINFDFLTRNFMQTPDGKVIAVDPIISSSLFDILMDIQKDNSERRERDQRERQFYQRYR